MKPACETFHPLLFAYADGEVRAADRRAVDTHLSACPDCKARLADIQASREAFGQALSAAADGVDFSRFADQVLAKVTPRREPFFARLRLWWSETLTYQRGVVIASLATAAVVLAVGVPLTWRIATSSMAERVTIASVGTEDPRFTPVVMQTEDGSTMVMFLDHERLEGDAPAAEDRAPKREEGKSGGDL